MAAYIIVLRERTKDAAQLEIYGGKARAAVAPGMKALAVYGRVETLEGTPFEGVVVLEFPTFEAAQAWYHSPAYQEAMQHRLKGGDYRFMIVQGL